MPVVLSLWELPRPQEHQPRLPSRHDALGFGIIIRVYAVSIHSFQKWISDPYLNISAKNSFITSHERRSAFSLYADARYDEAERAFRSWLTQYTVWFHEHTVPFVEDDPVNADELLVVDIEDRAAGMTCAGPL